MRGNSAGKTPRHDAHIYPCPACLARCAMPASHRRVVFELVQRARSEWGWRGHGHGYGCHDVAWASWSAESSSFIGANLRERDASACRAWRGVAGSKATTGLSMGEQRAWRDRARRVGSVGKRWGEDAGCRRRGQEGKGVMSHRQRLRQPETVPCCRRAVYLDSVCSNSGLGRRDAFQLQDRSRDPPPPTLTASTFPGIEQMRPHTHWMATNS
ncbi:hypothetical protein FB45DRAFT_1008555 [Roridomyces roridus]|uniref:Uncharacterized protein n=1 Tax=Roridomyces roridus TaxID=1738132 RepID=A0AAD7BAL7_9AGAR|nr:hypothetical protein FB45DRAFT_1008555 [Roridomyces roridus]